QPFIFEGDDGSAVIGSGGTTFAPTKNKTLLLKEGKLVAMAGGQGLVIETAHGSVKIPSTGATIVQQSSSGVVRVANLSGGRTNMAITKDGQTKLVAADPGEEIVVADSSLGEEELIPVDGVDREPITGAVAVAGTRIQKNRFDRAMMAGREQLLTCNTGCFTIMMRKKFDDVKQEMTNPRPAISQKPDVRVKARALAPAATAPGAGEVASRRLDVSGLTPIGFMQPAMSAAGSPSGLFTLGTRAVTVKHNGRARLSLEAQGTVNLKSGSVLIHAAEPTTVKAGDYRVFVEAGTIAVVSRTADVLTVRNLYEGSAHSVHFIVGGKSVTVAAGQEALVSAQHEALTRALKSEPVGRRNMRNFDMPGGHSMTRGEVSLVSLFVNDEVIKRLMASGNERDKAIAGRLLKMAAVLNQVTAGRGAYSPVAPQ
ncbi:MAG TPA: hypothetical protein V6D08_01455, partial [Candidatus Obscuribacterales bacterium]